MAAWNFFVFREVVVQGPTGAYVELLLLLLLPAFVGD